MSAQVIRVGAREFREELAEYLDSPVPVAITRHGRTVGYYVPTRVGVDEEDRLALSQAVGRLEQLLAEHGVSPEEVANAFRGRRTRR